MNGDNGLCKSCLKHKTKEKCYELIVNDGVFWNTLTDEQKDYIDSKVFGGALYD